MSRCRTLGVLLFPDFELLDVFGPLEMFGSRPAAFRIRLVAAWAGPVASRQGPRLLADGDLADPTPHDILLVPGGRGTRAEVDNPDLLAWIARQARSAEIVASVCTGAALLARAGVLDGRRATTNKLAFDWVRDQGPQVTWVRKARWVEDGNVFSSAGVSAGIDMSLALIARLLGADEAERIAAWAEYEWHRDPDRDPFCQNSLIGTDQ